MQVEAAYPFAQVEQVFDFWRGILRLVTKYRSGMADRSAIEWTEATWNPVTGCAKVSPGLRPLLRRDVRRALARRPGPPLRAGLRPPALAGATRAAAALAPAADDLRQLDERPVPRGRPGRLHRRGLRRHGARGLAHVPDPDQAPRAAGRARARAAWPANVWMGVTIENRRFVHRADYLREVPAAVRFISRRAAARPARGPGPRRHPLADRRRRERAHGTGPCKAEWLRELRDRCTRSGVAFFFKQWGGRTPKAGGRELDGRTWDEMPTPRSSSVLVGNA